MADEAGVAVAGQDPDAFARSMLSVIALAAWLAIFLGLVVQGLILFAKIAAGGKVTTLQLPVDATSGVTWSALVCSGIAVGPVTARNCAAIMGLLGLVSAPVAWAASKGVQRGVQWMIGTPIETIGPLVYQVGVAKTLEYALLGVLVGRLLRTTSSTLRAHALTGLAVGLVFGSAMPTVRVVAISVNELIFPVGCAVVIYFVARLADRTSAIERLAAGGG